MEKVKKIIVTILLVMTSHISSSIVGSCDKALHTADFAHLADILYFLRNI